MAMLQGVSAVFILWAIIRLWMASGTSLTVKELVKQKFITLHFLTLLVYLAALVLWNIVWARWDNYDLNDENRVYVMWTIVTIFMSLVQLSLIFLFINLSAPEVEADSSRNSDGFASVRVVDVKSAQGSNLKYGTMDDS